MRKNIAKFGICLVCLLGFLCCVSNPQKAEKPIEKKLDRKTEKKVDFAEKLQKILRNGNIDEALMLFEKIPSEFENDFSINLLHASLLISAKRFEEADLAIAKLASIDNENIDLLVVKTMLAKARGDTKKKNELLQEIIKKDPSNSDAYVELANDQMLRKNFKLANRYYKKSIESTPTNVDALFGYGQTSYYMGSFKEARNSFNQILESDPENSMAWAYLGKLENENENYGVAVKYIEKAIEFDSSYYDYWVDYGNILYHLGKFADAEKAWNKSIELEPENFLAYVYRAALYDEENRFAESLADYKKIIEIKPQYFYAFESIGILAWHEEKWQEARNAFLKAYEYNPESVSYPLMISATYLKEGKLKDNQAFLRVALKNKDTNSNEYALLRLYYDGVAPAAVGTKVNNETSTTLKGKLSFYLGLYHSIKGDDLMAKKYYTTVQSLKCPMFFEYRLNEWELEK